MNHRSSVLCGLAILVANFAMNFQAHAKTFVYCTESGPTIFNPQLATDGPTFNASSRTIYNRLVEFKPGSTEVRPSLAESWQISKDGLVYTFKLRKGVRFHTTATFNPQRDFNADDVVFTFSRMKDKSHPFHLVSGGTYQYWHSMDMSNLVKSVEKVDDGVVRITLTRQEAPFLANIAMDFASILSAEYGAFLRTEGKLERMDLDPVGTGPYKLKKYVKDSQVRFEANENYFRGKPKIDDLVFSITPDPNVRTQKLKTGECHLIAEPAPSDLKGLKANPSIRLLEEPGLNVGYLAMNVEKKPLDDLNVRMAIYHALNRKSYIDAIYLGNAEVAKNPMPPTIWGYNKSTKDHEYNIQTAKEYLKKANLANGFEIELWTLPVSRPYNPNGKKMGELIQADLGKIGIKVKLVTYKWETYLAKASKGEHQLLQLGWNGDNGDPDNFLGVLLSCASISAGSNYARWCNKGFGELLSQARLTSDVAARTKLYLRAQDIFNKEVPWVPIAHSKQFRAMRANVEGYTVNPFGTEIFDNLDLK